MLVNARKIDGTFISVQSDELTQRIAVKSIIIKDEKILIMPQFDGYDFPGGGVEKGETPEFATIRETKEETGFDVKLIDIIGAYSTIYVRHGSEKLFHQINLFYLAEIVGGNLTCENFTASENNYQLCPRFETLSFLENNVFKMYIDEYNQILNRIRKELSVV